MNISALFLLTTLLCGCTISNEINITTQNDDIHFLFPKDKNVLVYHYEINDYENFENDGITYKRLYISKEINKKMDKIVFKNYRKRKILSNHAYSILIGEQGLNKNGIGFTSLGFCISNDKIITKNKKENTSAFIKKCHILS